MHLYNFLVCGPKFTRFLLSNVGGVVVDQILLVFRYVDQFWGYSRSKSKVARNRTEIWTFFGLPNFRGRVFQKLYTRYEPCIAAHRLKKFHEDIPTSREVIGAHTLNFKPNFKFSITIFSGDPLPR